MYPSTNASVTSRMRWKSFICNLTRSSVLLYTMLIISTLNGAHCAEGSTKKGERVRITKPTVPTTASTTVSTANSPAYTPTEGVSSTRNTPAQSTTTNMETTAPVTPDICIHGIKAVLDMSDEEQSNVLHEHQFVQVIQGDVMLSVLTTDPTSALFVVNRINKENLLEAEFEIGLRAIMIDDESLVENLLIQEIEYLQQCIKHAMGIFLDYHFYKDMENVIRDLEYNIWPIPSSHGYIFPKVAHLLSEMPWDGKIASVEILAENLDIYNEFMEFARREQMCLMHFKSADNVYIVFGSKMTNHFKENGTIFAVPIDHTDRAFVSELPDKSYVLMENEIDVHLVDKNTTMLTLNEALMGKKILPSRVFSFAKPVLDLMHWLKGSLKNCKRVGNTINLKSCVNFLTFIEDWHNPEYREEHTTIEVLDILKIHMMDSYMNFKMYQKKSDSSETSGSVEEYIHLQEIASQSFVTNRTTKYLYNPDNHTSFEMKMTFGQVFNCQYTAGDNKRYPFLFDGESVMFWRIKPDAWVATGMTAAILGVIITLAILVFIVVRISLGDVFEGNPVTSILLLLSLVLLFSSFIPFSMEYVGEHRNSHVTYEDAGTLNTLCAVRVFILTLVYCFAFSLLLCRAVMLASIGSEGGFLSHVNGYIQAIICIFSVLVQLCMSIQLLVVMHVASDNVSCENMYYGHWLWGLIAYDLILLICIVALIPFIYRSQRNYREGILIVIGTVLTFVIWIVWIVMSLFGDEIRDAAIPLGLQATGWAILVGVLIPRTFLIVRGIERSDIAQALPSLTSLAFAQNNQYSSEQSVYECVNPAMRQCSAEDMHQSPSEIPTLPLRGGGPRRQQFFANLRQANASINPQRPPPRPQNPSTPHSSQSSLPPSPENSKITRF